MLLCLLCLHSRVYSIHYCFGRTKKRYVVHPLLLIRRAIASLFAVLLTRLTSFALKFQDIASYEEVQKVLRDEVVNPLRKNLFVRADRVMKLRQLLERLSSVTGLTCEEKDPEEFLNSLLAQIMRADPFLKVRHHFKPSSSNTRLIVFLWQFQLNSGQDAFYYQLFVEKDERLSFPTVQQLFEQSFLASDIKLKEVPSCLIIQMPRFGKNFKMYPRILPSQVLDVTDVIEGCKHSAVHFSWFVSYM